jgi:hypothetical protein
MAKLPRDALDRGVITSSAGNHAQGVALAASRMVQTLRLLVLIKCLLPSDDLMPLTCTPLRSGVQSNHLHASQYA